AQSRGATVLARTSLQHGGAEGTEQRRASPQPLAEPARTGLRPGRRGRIEERRGGAQDVTRILAPARLGELPLAHRPVPVAVEKPLDFLARARAAQRLPPGGGGARRIRQQRAEIAGGLRLSARRRGDARQVVTVLGT